MDPEALIAQAERCLAEGRLHEASQWAEQAVEADLKNGNRSSIARKMNVLGTVRTAQQRPAEADEIFEDAIRHALWADDRQARASLQLSRSRLYLSMDRVDDALEEAQQAVIAFRGGGDWHGEVMALNALGNAERYRKQLPRAIAWYDRALTIAERMSDVPLQWPCREATGP